MRTRIQKWGNSLGVRIPKTLAAEVGLLENSDIELSLENGRLILMPVPLPVHLDDLLAQISEDRLHNEVDWGAPVGNELG